LPASSDRHLARLVGLRPTRPLAAVRTPSSQPPQAPGEICGRKNSPDVLSAASSPAYKSDMPFDDPRRYKRFLNRISKKTRTYLIGRQYPTPHTSVLRLVGFDGELQPKWQTHISHLELAMNRTPRRCADVVIERLRWASDLTPTPS
jgi:hypothetical protein